MRRLKYPFPSWQLDLGCRGSALYDRRLTRRNITWYRAFKTKEAKKVNGSGELWVADIPGYTVCVYQHFWKGLSGVVRPIYKSRDEAFDKTIEEALARIQSDLNAHALVVQKRTAALCVIANAYTKG